MSQHHQVVIIGAGVSGSALLYLAARYTDIGRIGVIEKYAAPARVNSLSSNNSQTLHCGDIETNYTLEKALKVQRAARMVESMDTSPQRATVSRLVSEVRMRSRMGLPYFVSPIWKNGVSSVISMKLPCG